MTLRYLLDTNILADLIRHPSGIVAQRIATVGESAICASLIAAAELRFSATKSGSARLSERVDRILSALDVLPLEPPADRAYAEIRWHLAHQGTPIRPNGLLIAAQARALGLTVVTANAAEFVRVPGLSVENWLAGG